MSKRQQYFKHPLTGEWVTQERLHQDCLQTMIENRNGLLTEEQVTSAKRTLEKRYRCQHHLSAVHHIKKRSKP